MRKIWLITDTHFGHHKIIELCGRPEDYEEKLFASMAKIPKKDTLIHLGDICMGHDSTLHTNWIEPLDCNKILVKGNHDKKSSSWYLDHGWDFVVQSIVIRSLGHYIHLSHIPIPQEHLLTNAYNIHGHFHNNAERDTQFKDNPRAGDNPKVHLRLAVEYTNYQALTLDYVVEHPERFRIGGMDSAQV